MTIAELTIAPEIEGLSRPRVAEFFAGIGLVGLALEQEGFEVVYANDIDPAKQAIYAANFDAGRYHLGDIRRLHGWRIPDIEVATASFPCTDLSLAGNRVGLAGGQSGTFWEFARVLHEMGFRRPTIVVLENVPGFATSHNGRDFQAAISRLNDLGYVCDALLVDARWFVPQSRPRLFVIGWKGDPPAPADWTPSLLRPRWLCEVIGRFPELKLFSLPVTPPINAPLGTLSEIVERMPPSDHRWWDAERTARFVQSLSAVQMGRLAEMQRADSFVWATAYRRTRQSGPVWEIRPDSISGCLRTARGGSSKQALVEAGTGDVRVRWMTPLEYARLQGVPDDFRVEVVRPNQALFAFGDAVCVQAVAWLAREYLSRLVRATAVRALKQ